MKAVKAGHSVAVVMAAGGTGHGGGGGSSQVATMVVAVEVYSRKDIMPVEEAEEAGQDTVDWQASW